MGWFVVVESKVARVASWEIMITLQLINRQSKPLFPPFYSRPSLLSIVQRQCNRQDIWHQKLKHVEKLTLCGPTFHRYDFKSFVSGLPLFFWHRIAYAYSPGFASRFSSYFCNVSSNWCNSPGLFTDIFVLLRSRIGGRAL